MMQRRKFLKATAGFTILPASAAKSKTPDSKSMDRIGLSTSVFRARFEQTKTKRSDPLTDALTLQDVPAFYANRFKIHNLEFWSKHFDSRNASYLDSLKEAAAKTGSRLVNLQIDDKYNLADGDKTGREGSISIVKSWIDAAARLGMESVRANTGKGEVETAIASLTTLSDYAKSRGVLLLVENHGGISMVPETLQKILHNIDSPNLRALPDFGNYPDNKTRYTALKDLIPHAHLISAKITKLDADGKHPEFDFSKCVRIAEDGGFQGIYSIEQWTRSPIAASQEEAVDWAIGKILAEIEV